MKISFELDQTLLSSNSEFPTEKQNIFQKVLRFERLRLGARELMQDIIANHHEIWIYTASSRPKHYVKELFLRHDVNITDVINRKRHVTSLNAEKAILSKFPPGFGIDVHIDYSPNVKIDSEIFDFKTIIVKPDQDDWADIVRRNLLG